MPKVKFKNTGEEVEVAEGSKLSDATKDAGWPIAFGCEDGVCGTCVIQVPEGKENIAAMEDHEKQTLTMMGMDNGDYRLTCQCKVNGDCCIEAL